MHTRSMLGLVDWHLITLFCGLFIVVRAINLTGAPSVLLAYLADRGWPLTNPYLLSVTAMGLSNMVSNVPATVLLSPHLPSGQQDLWYTLSLATTSAGNLLTIGSLANLIVIEQARTVGIHITFWDYVKTGVLVTTVNVLILFGWIWLQMDPP